MSPKMSDLDYIKLFLCKVCHWGAIHAIIEKVQVQIIIAAFQLNVSVLESGYCACSLTSFLT